VKEGPANSSVPRPLHAESLVPRPHKKCQARPPEAHVFHHGHSFYPIFELDDGFAIFVDEKPWKEFSKLFPLWPEDRLRSNRLGSLLVVFALLVEDVFNSMVWLGEAIINSFQEPPKPILEEHVYLRTPFVRHLHHLSWYEREQWLMPEEVLSAMAEVLPTNG
jgi:hypothetical protein